MFEKFSNLDVDIAGSGGEYTVQAGFGWTNGVVLWVASQYGDVLVTPQCPVLSTTQTGSTSTNGAAFLGAYSVLGFFAATVIGVAALL